MNWTPEAVESAKRLWLDGHSAGEIAGRLGNGATRNAVLGKLHRMKLTGPQAAPRAERIAVLKPGPKPSGATKARMAQIRPKAEPLHFGKGPQQSSEELEAEREAGSLPHAPWEPLPGQAVVPLVELRRQGQCRWPIGDPREPGFGFCGAHTHGDTVYCRTHALRAWPALRGEARPTKEDAERGKFKTLALR